MGALSALHLPPLIIKSDSKPNRPPCFPVPPPNQRESCSCPDVTEGQIEIDLVISRPTAACVPAVCTDDCFVGSFFSAPAREGFSALIFFLLLCIAAILRVKEVEEVVGKNRRDHGRCKSDSRILRFRLRLSFSFPFLLVIGLPAHSLASLFRTCRSCECVSIVIINLHL